MVNTISHLGFGLLIALALNLKGKPLKTVAFLSILPDLDFIPYILFFLISDCLTHTARNQLFYLLGHREFMHSLIFIFLITLILWLKTKDRLLTAAGFSSVFLHFFLDYSTSWKMRPFYPFSTDSSILGAVYFFDPVVNLLPLLPLFVLGLKELKHGGKFEGRFNKFCAFMDKKGKKVYTALLIVLLVWLLAAPFTKFLLVKNVSGAEGAELNYWHTYPESSGGFLSAYSYNATHYKVLEFSYGAGIERSMFIEKVSVVGDVPEASVYAARAGKLYRTGVPQELDYPVYSVYEEKGGINVVLSDARNPYVKQWTYFQTVYRFVFDRENGEYVVYASVQGREEERLAENWMGG
ncbi:MAG: metal-dependent hydrolase [Victivallales bacterium]